MFDPVVRMLQATDSALTAGGQHLRDKLDMAHLIMVSNNPYPTAIRNRILQGIVDAVVYGLVAVALFGVVAWTVHTLIGAYQSWGISSRELEYEIPVVVADEMLCDEGGFYSLITFDGQQVKFYHNPVAWPSTPPHKNVDEAYLPGSCSTPVKEPAFALHFHSNGRVLGQAFRWANYVVLPSHVLHTLQQAMSEEDTVVRIVHGTRSFPLPRVESLKVVCDSGELDLAAFSLAESVFTNLQVKRANLAYIPEFSAVASVYTLASGGKWVMAIVPLERGKGNAFEFSHKASTCPGNSGAPIVIGGKVVGFHARTEDGRNFGRAIAVL
jgi:hypothetical protein